jgi:hypothetical protein
MLDFLEEFSSALLVKAAKSEAIGQALKPRDVLSAG